LVVSQQNDRILEGVRPSEVASLRALADGKAPPARPDMVPLHAKGWVDMFGDVAIITLTGRALLDRQPSGLR
jgi:hypothetical protein